MHTDRENVTMVSELPTVKLLYAFSHQLYALSNIREPFTLLNNITSLIPKKKVSQMSFETEPPTSESL